MYCKRADVEEKLELEIGSSEYEAEINALISEAQAIIDNKLRKYTTVPLVVVPDLIGFACVNLAAGLYKRKLGVKDSDFYTLGMEQVQQYIDESFSAEQTATVFKAATDEADLT